MYTSCVPQLNLTKRGRCWYTLTATSQPARTHQRALLVLCMSFKVVHHVPATLVLEEQIPTARSTTEAELIACASALLGEALNLHTMIEPLTEVRVPVSFQQDNQAATDAQTAMSCSSRLTPKEFLKIARQYWNRLTMCMYRTRGSYWFVGETTTYHDVLHAHVSCTSFCVCDFIF